MESPYRLQQQLDAERVEKERWQSEANRLVDQVNELTSELDRVARVYRRVIPAWARWAIFGVGLVLAMVGLYFVWGWVFGADEVEAAKQAEKQHQSIVQYLIALTFALFGTAVTIIVLTFVLDPWTVRREFLEDVKNGTAPPLAKAIFSVGTALLAGLVFLASFDALSLH